MESYENKKKNLYNFKIKKKKTKSKTLLLKRRRNEAKFIHTLTATSATFRLNLWHYYQNET